MNILPTESTLVKCIKNNLEYVIQFEKATVNSHNVCGFDHKFYNQDLEFLKSIAIELGLNPIIEGNSIEFQDDTLVNMPAFDLDNFMNVEVIDNYDSFVKKVTQIFIPVK